MTNGESSSIPADFGLAFTDSNGNILSGYLLWVARGGGRRARRRIRASLSSTRIVPTSPGSKGHEKIRRAASPVPRLQPRLSPWSRVGQDVLAGLILDDMQLRHIREDPVQIRQVQGVHVEGRDLFPVLVIKDGVDRCGIRVGWGVSSS